MRTTTYTSPIDRYRHGVAILTDKLGPVDAMNGVNGVSPWVSRCKLTADRGVNGLRHG